MKHETFAFVQFDSLIQIWFPAKLLDCIIWSDVDSFLNPNHTFRQKQKTIIKLLNWLKIFNQNHIFLCSIIESQICKRNRRVLNLRKRKRVKPSQFQLWRSSTIDALWSEWLIITQKQNHDCWTRVFRPLELHNGQPITDYFFGRPRFYIFPFCSPLKHYDIHCCS